MKTIAMVACALALAVPSVAAADDITIGLFAPTAPFEGSGDRVSFVNAVAQLETGLPAERLLDKLHEVEARHGRKRSFPNAPRTLDLDLLLFGEAQLRSPTLTVPHPRMHERAFVLEPLLEIAPHLAQRFARCPGKVERMA